MDAKKIFIVDDDEALLVSLKKLLTELGFEVGVTTNPKDAFLNIKIFQPDLILLDLLMPRLSGYEVLEFLNNDEETKGTPVIVVSALIKEVDKKRAYRLGVVSYITKPYDFQILMTEINRALSNKENK